jgi:hypothetical protein
MSIKKKEFSKHWKLISFSHGWTPKKSSLHKAATNALNYMNFFGSLLFKNVKYIK